jgi:O-antigen/teichoic acid export membrane protein
VDVASLAIGASNALLLALLGVDAGAVVALYLTAAAASAVLYLLVGRAARPRLHRRVLGELFGFGAPTALAAAAYTVFRHVDYAILATSMTPTNVGLYWRAHVLAADYQSRISSVALRIAFPVYSRADSASQARALALDLIRLQVLVIAPVVATIVVVAPTAIPVLFGEPWVGAVVPTQILACAGLLAALTAALGPLILASGRPRTLLAFNLCAIAVYAPLVYASAPFGLTLVCSVVVLFHSLALLSQVHVTGRITGLRLRALAGAVAPGAACGGLTLVAEAMLLGFLKQLDVSSVVVLATVPTIGAAVHIGAVRAFFPRLFGVVRALASTRPAEVALGPVT